MQNKLFLKNIEKNINKIFSTTNFLNLFKDNDLKFTFKIKRKPLIILKHQQLKLLIGAENE